MTEEYRALLEEFTSRFLPGDHVCSKIRTNLPVDEKYKNLNYVFEVQGVSKSCMSSINNDDELLVILKCMWNEDMWMHIPLKEFLGIRNSTYNFKRIDINKLIAD